jgi:hypothetical protein
MEKRQWKKTTFFIFQMTTTSILLQLLVCSLVSWCQSQEMQQRLQHSAPHFVGSGNQFLYDAQEPKDQLEIYDNLLTNYRHLFVQSLLNLNEVCGLFDYLSGEPKVDEQLEGIHEHLLSVSTLRVYCFF